MIYFFYFLHVVISLFLIMVVLLQQGKGADLSVFGGGGTMTAFGARGAATLLHKMTVGAFVGFIVTTLVIGVLQSQTARSTVMSGIAAEEETQEAAEEAAPTSLLEEDAPAAEATSVGEPAADDAASGDTEAGDGMAPADDGDGADASVPLEDATSN